jgi:hypothetical protein
VNGVSGAPTKTTRLTLAGDVIYHFQDQHSKYGYGGREQRPGLGAGSFYLSATVGRGIISFCFAGVHVSLDIYQSKIGGGNPDGDHPTGGK